MIDKWEDMALDDENMKGLEDDKAEDMMMNLQLNCCLYHCLCYMFHPRNHPLEGGVLGPQTSLPRGD